MGSAIHIKTRVLPGKKIEISSRNLEEGQLVDVFVTIPASPQQRRQSVLQMLNTTPAPGAFTTPDEVEEYIRKERDSFNC